MKCEIIFEDKEILVIRKPAGFPTQTSSVSQPDAVSELKSYLAKTGGKAGTKVYLGVIHRLDQPVEGLLVFAKTPAAAAKLTKNLSQGSLHKQYYAVVCGKPYPASGELVDYLLKEQNNTAKVVTGSEKQYPEAKYAKLRYQTIASAEVPRESDHTEISLLDISIETGRFHQIRAQMAHVGYPLLGDRKYGNAQSEELSKVYGVTNVALCAYQLEITHPATGKKMSWKTEPSGKAFSIIKQ